MSVQRREEAASASLRPLMSTLPRELPVLPGVNLVRALGGAVTAQLLMTRRNVELLFPLITMPLFGVVAMAIFAHARRPDLVGRSITIGALLTAVQMAVFVAGELVSEERKRETLELAVVSPTPFPAVVAARMLVLACFGAAGIGETLVLNGLIFATPVAIHHPALLVETVALTCLGSASLSLVLGGLFCLSRSTRGVQYMASGPIVLLGGVVVPAQLLPAFVQPISKSLYIYWSGELLRASLSASEPIGAPIKLLFLAGTGLATGIGGAVLLWQMLRVLRSQGRLAVS